MKLEDYELITSDQYDLLVDPQFEGQTRVVDNIYYMCWSSNGKLYKTQSKLNPYK
jgi:hypothetical protein